MAEVDMVVCVAAVCKMVVMRKMSAWQLVTLRGE
jgi:hypothetical protein